jgi:DNA-binding MarR family transcriptional regulator
VAGAEESLPAPAASMVDRLVRHGLVERCGCDVDRRGVYVVLTEAGEQRHAEAVPTHRGVLVRTLPASML